MAKKMAKASNMKKSSTWNHHILDQCATHLATMNKVATPSMAMPVPWSVSAVT
jgi:hypothetical protein